MRIFLAHASEDRRYADELTAKLRARGFSVFYSKDTMLPGQSFDERIRSEIAHCSALVFLLSPASVRTGCYALTELAFASDRWPNPRDRLLAVMVEPVPMAQIPTYLATNVHLLIPQGDFATESAEAVRDLRRRQLRHMFSQALYAMALLTVVLLAGAFMRGEDAGTRIERRLLEVAHKLRPYTDACVERFDNFDHYTPDYRPPINACNAAQVYDKLVPPFLIVAEPGAGKRSALEYIQFHAAHRGKASLLVSWRDCVRHSPTETDVDLSRCLSAQLRDLVPDAQPEDIRDWLKHRERYMLLFDAIDDSASTAKTFALVRALYNHHDAGGTVAMSTRAQSLLRMFHSYGLEQWVIWLRSQVTIAAVRGISLGAAERAAAYDERHQVPPEDVRTVLDFAQQCEDARPLIEQWITRPKLYNGRGSKSIAPTARAIRRLHGDCGSWRRTVLVEMFRALVWSHCHDELCNWEVESTMLLDAARQLEKRPTLTEADLNAVAREKNLPSANELAFPLLGVGVLRYQGDQLRLERAWIPD
jgi:hypothetical protein